MVKWIFWFWAVSLTFVAGKLSGEFWKWLVVLFAAPPPEAKGIMVNYLLSAALPVLLLGVPAAFCWSWLFRSAYRAEALAFLALELALLAYLVYMDVQAGASVLLRHSTF